MKSYNHIYLPVSLVALCLAITGCSLVMPRPATNAPVIKLGVMWHSAKEANDEFRKYHAFAADLRKAGVEAFFIDQGLFLDPRISAEETYKAMKEFHVVYIHQLEDGAGALTEAMAQSATSKGEAIARYVREGGGLLVAPSVVRYPGADDQKYWNLLFKPLGLEALREGVVDKTRTLKARTEWLFDTSFWYSKNIGKHPVTDGIKSLWFPYTADGPMPRRPGTVAIDYSPDWQVIVKGEKEAASFAMNEDNGLALDRPGTFKTEPPVVAVRELGIGRVVSYPVFISHVVDQYGKKDWRHIVEREGDGKIPGNGMKLFINACKWLAAPCLGDPQFGTCEIKPFQEVKWAETTTWPHAKLAAPRPGPTSEVRGIVGAHTSYSDGEGTVADYVKAAKEAGLAFIIFSESLEKMTPEKLEALKKDCAEASKDPAFFACPGIEFSDHMDNRWAFWGDKVQFPPPPVTFNNKTYTQWDGKRVNQYLNYASGTCNFTRGSALISYKNLEDNGGHAEKLTWYYQIFPLAYEKDRLIADNTGAYRATQRDLRRLVPTSFTRIHSPAELPVAAETITTRYPGLAEAKAGLTGSFSSWTSPGYASQGPQILRWEGLGTQGGLTWRRTRGMQRAVARFAVHSDAGIAEIKVHDADQGVFRRFDAQGAKDFAQDFELVSDKQHYLMLEVVDVNGRKAFSPCQWAGFSYNDAHMRCGDNANIQDTIVGIHWPQTEEMIITTTSTPRGIFEEMLRDGAGPLAPLPVCHDRPEKIFLEGVGEYPKLAQGKVLDIRLASANIVIDRMVMDKLSDMQSPDRSHPGWGNKDVAENEYFTRTHTSYFVRDKRDFSLSWGLRRYIEADAAYEGNLIWNEGEYRFKKDCVLASDVPIPLVKFVCPRDKERGYGGSVVARDAQKGRQLLSHDETKDVTLVGRLSGGGFVTQAPCGRWHPAFLAPPDSDFVYSAFFPKDWISGEWTGDRLLVGLGAKGQAIKAGTVMKYRFASGILYDRETGGNSPEASWSLLDHTAKALNMGGGHDGYPVKMEVGEVADAVFFFTAKAARNEAAFTLGPQKLIFDLPIKVEGLEDNGCAAVYSSVRKWFRFVPVLEGTTYFQESIDSANRMWVGNLFVSDNKNLKLTVVIDGQPQGAAPFVEVHNPTATDVATNIFSPPNTPDYGGMTALMKIPAGASLRWTINDHRFEPLKE